MEGMIANSPCNSTLFIGGGALICLTFNAEVHNVVSADSAGVYNNVPGPQRHGVPLLDFEALLWLSVVLFGLALVNVHVFFVSHGVLVKNRMCC